MSRKDKTIRNQDNKHESGITAGDIQGTGIVVGHGSSVSIRQGAPVGQQEVIARLDEFLRLLAAGGMPVPDPISTRELAETARDEAGKPEPKWHAVRGVLRAIEAGLPRASALTEIIVNVQALVSHIAR